MSMTDPIADMLTRIRNAQSAMHKQVGVPASRIKIAIADVLKNEGYISDYKIEQEGVKKNMIIFLKYFEEKKVIELIKRISIPGRRVYRNYKDLKPVLGGMGIAILSTSKGVMTDRAAKKAQLGGEILCEVA